MPIGTGCAPTSGIRATMNSLAVGESVSFRLGRVYAQEPGSAPAQLPGDTTPARSIGCWMSPRTMRRRRLERNRVQPDVANVPVTNFDEIVGSFDAPLR